MTAQHAHGCCADEACTNNSCMELPKGKTCGDCYAFRHCAGMYAVTKERTSCDFFPRRFREPLANAAAPAVQRMPADDTEGGAA